MSSTTISASETFYALIAVVLLAVARIGWRTFANFKGTVFSHARTVLYAVVYVTLGIVFSALSFFQGVSILVAVPEVALVLAAGFWSYKYTDKRISFWKSKNGSLYFRGGIGVYLIYLVGFLTRLAISATFIGTSMFDFGSLVQLNGPALYASMASDLLLTLGVGLLIGRNIRVTERYQRIQSGEEAVPPAPTISVSSRVQE